MKLLKTIGLYVLVLAMLVTMTACGTKDGGETTTAAPTTTLAGEATTIPATTTTAASGTTQAGDTTAAPTTADGITTGGATTESTTTTQPGATTGETTVPPTTVPVTTVPTTAAPTTAAPTTAAPATTAAPSDGRVTYSTSLGAISNKADITNVGPPVETQYLLPQVYSGTVTINFDMKSTSASPDAMVGFVASPVVSYFKYYTHMSIQVAMGSTFKIINGADWVAGPAVAQGTTYKITITANMDAHTFNVSINGTAVGAGNFAFRTRGQNPVDTFVKDASDLAMVVVAGASDNMIQMSNLAITDNTP